jgi:hypothetical protein
MARINEAVPAYIPSMIPGGTYEGIDEDTLTPAVSALLVTSSEVEEELIYGITQALWNEATRRMLDNGHPKGRLITSDTALAGMEALGVPLHPGAQRYYEEAGLME